MWNLIYHCWKYKNAFSQINSYCYSDIIYILFDFKTTVMDLLCYLTIGIDTKPIDNQSIK